MIKKLLRLLILRTFIDFGYLRHTSIFSQKLTYWCSFCLSEIILSIHINFCLKTISLHLFGKRTHIVLCWNSLILTRTQKSRLLCLNLILHKIIVQICFLDQIILICLTPQSSQPAIRWGVQSCWIWRIHSPDDRSLLGRWHSLFCHCCLSSRRNVWASASTAPSPLLQISLSLLIQLYLQLGLAFFKHCKFGFTVT